MPRIRPTGVAPVLRLEGRIFTATRRMASPSLGLRNNVCFAVQDWREEKIGKPQSRGANALCTVLQSGTLGAEWGHGQGVITSVLASTTVGGGGAPTRETRG